MTRKNFIAKIISVWSAIVSLPVFYAVISYIVPPRKPPEKVQPVDVGKVTGFFSEPVRLVRSGKHAFFVRKTESGQIRSFSAKCTHLGCLVEYRKDLAAFRCNCHGSVYDLNGRNLSGPAPRPLDPYRVEIKGGDIIVTLH